MEGTNCPSLTVFPTPQAPSVNNSGWRELSQTALGTQFGLLRRLSSQANPHALGSTADQLPEPAFPYLQNGSCDTCLKGQSQTLK